KRVVTNGGVCNSVNIEEKRVVAKSVVTVSVTVIKERSGADTVVVPAKWEAVCQRAIKQERVITHGSVAASGKVTIERGIANGGGWISVGVGLERLNVHCRVFAAQAL